MSPRLKSKDRLSAFSLVEVVVAVGIFAIAISAVIGLMVPVSRSVADVSDRDQAARLMTAIQGELSRLPLTTIQQTVDTPPAANDRLFANRDGSIIAFGNDSKWGNDLEVGETADSRKYYEVVLRRDSTLSPGGAANNQSAGFLAVIAEIRWPGYLPNGTRVTATEGQSILITPMAFAR